MSCSLFGTRGHCPAPRSASFCGSCEKVERCTCIRQTCWQQDLNTGRSLLVWSCRRSLIIGRTTSLASQFDLSRS